MTHACPIPDCAAKVPSSVYMCARHWRMVPRPLQAAVYASFRAGQGISKNHTEAVRVVTATEGGRAMPGLAPGMKALTIWQPWASLIMIGAKRYEFRRWNFTDKPHLAKLVGQRVVIHAGARPAKKGELHDVIERIDADESALIGVTARPFIQRVLLGEERLPLASALGTAQLGQPILSCDLFGMEVADSDRGSFNYAWPVTDIETFPAPIPAAGAQGFWNWN